METAHFHLELLLTALGLIGLFLGWRAVVVGRDLATTRRHLVTEQRGVTFYRMIAEHASDGVVVHGLDGRVTWANPAYCALMGRPLEEMIGRNPMSYAMPPDLTPSDAELAKFRYDPDDPSWQQTQLFRNRRPDGTDFWNQISVAYSGLAGDRDMVILICRDVTDQVRREEDLRAVSNQLRHAAAHDPLTGLANRAGFLRFAEQALAGEGRLGLLHIDLDKFKEINDTHGHAAGDAVLVHVAGALGRVLRDVDLAARLGGDEFLVACPDLPDLAVLARIGDRVMTAIAQPFTWQGRSLQVNSTIGADLTPPGDRDLGALVQRSDFALYEAKRNGRAQLACYDEDVHLRRVAEKELADDLAAAIRDGTLTFAFQPILDLAVGQIVTLETLVRWNHPTRGPLPPVAFLPLADELGLLAELDFHAMRAAMAQKALLNARRPSGLTITLNASGALLTHPDFLQRLAQTMADHALTPAEIGIEVLETVVFDAPGSHDRASQVISALRKAGHPVMLDDFGVGYAGLAHLAHLDVSGIKIDLSLVQAAKTDPTSVRILETMIELCSHLGLTSIAEGVDTVWMATRLQDMGCSRVQGWWLSPALPGPDILTWLDGHILPPPIAESGPGLYQPPDTTQSGTGDGQLPVRLSHGSGVKSLSRRQKSL